MSIGSVGLGKRKARAASGGTAVGYKVEEVAVLLRISKNATYELVQSGMIPSTRAGRLIRIPVEAFHQKFGGMVPSLEDWIRSLTAEIRPRRQARQTQAEINA
jgi:excisionase family DNA binding protein